MSHESRVTSHEILAAELARGFVYPNYRTIDFDDAFDSALERTTDVLVELDQVDVDFGLKQQAAFCVGQYYLDSLRDVVSEHAAEYFVRDGDAAQRPVPYMHVTPRRLLINMGAFRG
ncbi:hypothetical protein KC992_02775 [Candidatus Saccharibacteria bacterium]|nr:hypothetical protein [Candidatus Saccharibacteria bacterium]